MTIHTNEKAPEAANSKGLRLNTNEPDFLTEDQNISAFTKRGAVHALSPDVTGWRGNLAAGNGQFARKSAFFEYVGGRRARRAQERQNAKILARAGVPLLAVKKAGKP